MPRTRKAKAADAEPNDTNANTQLETNGSATSTTARPRRSLGDAMKLAKDDISIATGEAKAAAAKKKRTALAQRIAQKALMEITRKLTKFMSDRAADRQYDIDTLIGVAGAANAAGITPARLLEMIEAERRLTTSAS
jgi:hypothetical protein